MKKFYWLDHGNCYSYLIVSEQEKSRHEANGSASTFHLIGEFPSQFDAWQCLRDNLRKNVLRGICTVDAKGKIIDENGRNTGFDYI